jgi:hypothetical protein
LERTLSRRRAGSSLVNREQGKQAPPDPSQLVPNEVFSTLRTLHDVARHHFAPTQSIALSTSGEAEHTDDKFALPILPGEAGWLSG